MKDPLPYVPDTITHKTRKIDIRSRMFLRKTVIFLFLKRVKIYRKFV
jgi:hypothetical protein